jgi:hypothetical protein
MFGLFRKSPEKIAHEIFPLARQFGENIAELNPLNLSAGLELQRWRINAGFLLNLAAQDAAHVLIKDKQRALEISGWLVSWHLGDVSAAKPNRWKIADFVVWPPEREMLDTSSIDDAIRLHVTSDIPVPLPEIVRSLGPIRLWRLKEDIQRGARVQIQQGSWSLAMYMPVSSTFIIQSTGDTALSHDERKVTELSATLAIPFGALQAKIVELLA